MIYNHNENDRECQRVIYCARGKSYMIVFLNLIAMLYVMVTLTDAARQSAGLARILFVGASIMVPIACAKVAVKIATTILTKAGHYTCYLEGRVLDPFVDAPVPIEFISLDEWRALGSDEFVIVKMVPKRRLGVLPDVSGMVQFFCVYHVGENGVDKELRFKTVAAYRAFVAEFGKKKNTIEENETKIKMVYAFLNRLFEMPVTVCMNADLDRVPCSDWGTELHLPVPEHVDDVPEFKSVIAEIYKQYECPSRFIVRQALTAEIEKRELETAQSESNRAVTRMIKKVVDSLTVNAG